METRVKKSSFGVNLIRLPLEDLDFEELYKCYGYYVWVENGNKKRVKKCDVPARLLELFSYALQDNKEKSYINPKQKNNQVLENELGNMYSFAYGFRATRTEDGKIEKELRLFYRENDASDWIMSFKAPFRNEILQSAIIPSFRDPQTQLRLNQWGWYGRLMKHLTQGCEKNEELQEALGTVNRVAGSIFSGISEQITQSAVKSGISRNYTSISVQY